MVDLYCTTCTVGRWSRDRFRAVLNQLKMSDNNFVFSEEKNWIESYFSIKGTQEQLDYLEDYFNAYIRI